MPPLSLTVEDMDSLDEIVKRGRPLKKGEFLFRQGDPFGSVFAVRSGALKTFSITDAGEEQITGFHLPSELVGLSGMDTETYPVSAQALETTSVCEIPFERLDELSEQLPQLRRQLMRLMSREIRDDQQMMLLLSKKTADERIATFLVNLSARFQCPWLLRPAVPPGHVAQRDRQLSRPGRGNRVAGLHPLPAERPDQRGRQGSAHPRLHRAVRLAGGQLEG